MEFLRRSTACVGWDFLLKIGIRRAKGITKNLPNLEVCELSPATTTTIFINAVIVVLY